MGALPRGVAILSLLWPAAATSVTGQDGAIQDNSFLLQEAYNQPAGIVQHVLTAERDPNGETRFVFGQEWPLAGVRHQAAFAIPLFCPCGEPGRSVGFGDIELGYRYQAAGAGGGRVHVAPELALSLPTGSARLERGDDAVGIHLTVPVSITVTEWLITHGNAGVSRVPGSTGWLLGGSLVWLARPKLNLLLETVWVDGEAAQLTLSPGIRGAVDVGRVQVVPGVAMPIVLEDGDSDTGWLIYLSVEHPFR